MIESLIAFLQSLPPFGVLGVTFFIAYVENIFPPSPSDVLLVFIGTLVGLGTVGFVETTLAATIGSVAGFTTAYLVGRRYGHTLVGTKWIPFVDVQTIEKVEHWFDKYHGWIIVANRFMAGTRAVVSFAAGIVRMPLPRTILYCTISAALWNGALVFIGKLAGQNWKVVEPYLSAYGWVVTAIMVVAGLFWYIRKRSKQQRE